MPALTPAELPSFAQTMDLIKINAAEETYMSTFPALTYDYAPNQPLSTARSYGGHAFAQALWAASIGIADSGLRAHEANGYWTQPGYADRPFIYEVKTLSMTRSFALRQVTARQPTHPSTACPFAPSDARNELGPAAFVLTSSFKRPEEGGGGGGVGSPSYGLDFDAAKFGDLVRGVDPATHPRDVFLRAPGGNGMIRLADFPSIDVRTPDLRAWNAPRPGSGYRRLHVYRASEPLRLDANLVAALHAYVSDRAGLDVLRNAFGADVIGVSGSLNHKIVFHVSPEEMRVDEQGWFVQEMSSSRGGQGRGLVESRIWSPQGVLVATTVQDMLFRKYQAKLA
ncbi:thioesterase-like superfamily-domain-containing protein [Aspergillus heterothallicus]